MKQRLQKLLAAAGLGSRREIEGWIEAGRVTVNGVVATLGQSATADDVIAVDGRPVQAAVAGAREVLLYHKPAGEVTTRFDPQLRPTVFAREGLVPKLAITARDADVIKTYVRLGLGVGIIASVAIEPAVDADLAVVDASHLFPIHTTWIGFRRGTLLRNYAYDFMQLFGPHLNRRLIYQAIEAREPEAKMEVLAKLQLPVR